MYLVVVTFLVGLMNFGLFELNARPDTEFLDFNVQSLHQQEGIIDLLERVQDTFKNNSTGKILMPSSSRQFLPKSLQNGSLHHGAALNKNIDLKARNEWIQQASILFFEDLPSSTYKELKIQKYTAEEFSYYKQYLKIDSKEMSRLVFEDGSFLIFKNHSVYDDATIGDITLVINERNVIYKNEGHICGGTINFVEFNQKEIKTSLDFIRYFKSDTDDKGWIILKR